MREPAARAVGDCALPRNAPTTSEFGRSEAIRARVDRQRRSRYMSVSRKVVPVSLPQSESQIGSTFEEPACKQAVHVTSSIRDQVDDDPGVDHAIDEPVRL